MVLFGKKESEEKASGSQPLQPENRNAPKNSKQTPPKPTSGAKASAASRDTTYLGKNLRINGTVCGEGNLIVLGTFDGEFDIKGQLKVAQGAVVKGNIAATDVSINGKMDGTIVAKERILLDTAASMKGRLVTPKISIQDGAIFDGELQMSGKSGQAQAEAQTPKAATPEAKPPTTQPAVSGLK
jgi:cytoskeletal protein CcmA (bactofilin family)